MVHSDSFRQIADHLTEVVWLVDPAFEEFRYINPAYERLVGRLVDEPSDRIQTLESLYPEDHDRFRDWLDTIRADIEADDPNDEYTIEFRIEQPDGELRWVETIAVPIFEEAGDVSGIAGITTDHTERVEQKRDLAETVQRLDEFASMVSHDLRNPISVARGRYDLYRETGDEEHLDAIGPALERIEELTKDLTALARHGSTVTASEPVSLAAVARDAWGHIDSRDAELVVEDATVDGDSGQLQALFENLFRNAVGHGGNDVTVRVGPLDGGFFVEDTGRGIPDDIREQVFEHGFTTGYGGSGVGLTIVGRIADAHDLNVALAESEAGGARFEFTSR